MGTSRRAPGAHDWPVLTQRWRSCPRRQTDLALEAPVGALVVMDRGVDDDHAFDSDEPVTLTDDPAAKRLDQVCASDG